MRYNFEVAAISLEHFFFFKYEYLLCHWEELNFFQFPHTIDKLLLLHFSFHGGVVVRSLVSEQQQQQMVSLAVESISFHLEHK